MENFFIFNLPSEMTFFQQINFFFNLFLSFFPLPKNRECINKCSKKYFVLWRFWQEHFGHETRKYNDKKYIISCKMSHSIFHCLIFYTCAILTSYMYLAWNPGSLHKLSQSIRVGQDAKLLQFLHREINHAFF